MTSLESARGDLGAALRAFSAEWPFLVDPNTGPAVAYLSAMTGG
jgi:hypothetical protein